MVEERGWDPVEGGVVDKRKKQLMEVSGNRGVKTQGANRATDDEALDKITSSPASLEPQIPDPIEETIRREQEKGKKPTVSGVVRGVETLGAWSGASLLASLRIKGVVEVERDSFLQHGLAGARRDVEASAGSQKAIPRPSMGWQTGWTLGPWA